MSTTVTLSSSASSTSLTELPKSSKEEAATSSASKSTSLTTISTTIHDKDPLNDLASTSHIQLPTSSHPTCRFFQRGICRFGSVCRFSHDLYGGEVISSGEQPSTSHTWANAPTFVPLAEKKLGFTHHTYDATTDAVFATNTPWGRQNLSNALANAATINQECPYECPCPYGIYCAYAIHMQLCEMCNEFCLHPFDVDQCKQHRKECVQQHEQAMELSFAIARSKDKTCGICFDTIMEKAGREKRFGILSNCNHIFCLQCIRKWRRAKQFEHKITRSCPECRLSSDFVCPSVFWVETKEEKAKLLGDYRKALGIKDCKYFKKGFGRCPFGNKCFYKHALANGDLVDVGCPKKSRKIQRRNNEIIDLVDVYLYQFFEQRNMNFLDDFDIDGDESDNNAIENDFN